MRAVVIYESMYGNTHTVAEAIGAGLGPPEDVVVVPVDEADRALLSTADLVVIGGPTHAHGMSRPATRHSAAEEAHKPDSDLTLEPDAEGPGLREWFQSIGEVHASAAAFDTRIDMAPILTGRASKGINRQLLHHGFAVIAAPESFLVTKESHLERGEEDRAREWGELLAATFAVANDRSESQGTPRAFHP